MSLQSNFPKEIPEQTREIGESILDESDVCHYLAHHIHEILSEADFEAMYSETGRGGVHPFILSIVTVLQYLEKYPDRRASEQVVKRLDWKYAMHQDLKWMGFHYSSLCNFLKRLLEHEASSLIFDKVIQHLLEKGWLKSRGKQRTDATHILGQVQRLSQFELKWEGLRMALVDIISSDSKWVLSQLSEEFTITYASSRNSYHLSDSKLEELEKQVDKDIENFLNLIEQEGRDEFLDLRFVKLLQRLALEQLDCIDPEEFPDWQDSALELDLPDGFLQSPHEPEARYAQKRGQSWQGYKTHISETVEGEHGDFVTDMYVTPANVNDTQALQDIQQNLAQRDLTPEQHYVDQGYMSGEQIVNSAKLA